MTMIFFFFISKVLPFRDLRISLSLKGRISFFKPFLNSLLRFSIFASLQMSYLYLFFLFFFPFPRLCMRSHPVVSHTSIPVTHAAKHTQLIRPFSRTCDTRSRTPGPAHQGERMVPHRDVSSEEMNLAPQHWVQTFVHNGSIHTHVW